MKNKTGKIGGGSAGGIGGGILGRWIGGIGIAAKGTAFGIPAVAVIATLAVVGVVVGSAVGNKIQDVISNRQK